MLPETAKDALTETMMQSLDTMAFVMAEPVAGPVDPPIDPVCVSMSFAGSKKGRVDIAASREFSLMLAANILGLDPSDPDAKEKADDCMKELVNVVGGALMPALASSPDEAFKLSLPTLRSLDVETDWPALASSKETQLYNADGHILASRLVEQD